MELSSEDGEIPIPIPIPINSSYGVGHMIHHDPAPRNHIIPTSLATQNNQMSSNGPPIPTTTLVEDHHVPYKKMVRYKECLKNHAASMGGSATDGCGEFMPNGEEGTLEALTCSACNCHRNFHRKEVEGEQHPSSCEGYHTPPHLNRVGGRRVILSHHHKNFLGPEALGYPTATFIPSGPAPPPAAHHQMLMSYNMGSLLPSESDEQEDGVGGGGGVVLRPPHHQMVKKRFRTKFTQEQKEKMLNFAEKVGWKIQKQEEAVVQQLCQEIGIKRRVLKVWMHNNKHNLAKKNPSSTLQIPI
ncbi:unnamed protein product [Camellia sinensis]